MSAALINNNKGDNEASHQHFLSHFLVLQNPFLTVPLFNRPETMTEYSDCFVFFFYNVCLMDDSFVQIAVFVSAACL